MMASGTATLGMNVARTSRRNTNTTRTTSTSEMISVRSTSATEARTVKCAVQRDVELDALRHRGLQERQLFDDPVHGGDDVGPGLPEDDDHDAGFAVEAAGDVGVGVGILNVGNIAETNRRAIVVSNDHAAR